MKKVIFFIFVILVISVMSVSASIINIPGDYATIQAGIDASTEGDTILVHPGTYYENVNFNGHDIVLGSLFFTTGDTSYISTTVLDGSSFGAVVTFQNGENNTAVVAGFTIQNGYYFCSGGIYCLNSNPVISNNIICDNSTDFEGGGIYCSLSNPVINNNVIRDNTANLGGGIYCYNSNPTIINNTIYGNIANEGGGLYINIGSVPVVTNTIFWMDSAMNGDEIYDGAGSAIITYCDIQGNWPGMSNINADPLFVDPANGNHHLQAGSPCIDAGDPSSPLEPDSTRCDIGAFYYDQQTRITSINTIPKEYLLLQNYPNPFNSSTTISFLLSEPQCVTLTVYDQLGRKIQTLLNEQQQAGYHQALWNADGFSSGVYFYKLQAGEYTETKKMLLVK